MSEADTGLRVKEVWERPMAMTSMAVVVSMDTTKYKCEAKTLRPEKDEGAGGVHTVLLDEPPMANGGDTGPTPVEAALIALASCKAMTCRMYADRKGWPLETIGVTASLVGREEIRCELELTGEGLDEEKKGRLKEIADKCPVHKMMAGETKISSAVCQG